MGSQCPVGVRTSRAEREGVWRTSVRSVSHQLLLLQFLIDIRRIGCGDCLHEKSE